MEALIIGVVTAFNFIIIKIKFTRGRYVDAILDLCAILVLGAMFAGTMGGLMIAMIASCIISIYLYFNSPKLVDDGEFVKTLKDKYDEISPRRT